MVSGYVAYLNIGTGAPACGIPVGDCHLRGAAEFGASAPARGISVGDCHPRAAAESRKMETVVMPMYEYRCNQCGETYEKLRRMEDADRNLKCPRCEADDVRRLLSVFAAGGGCDAVASSGFS